MSKLKLASILLLGATLIFKVSSMLREMSIAYLFGDSYITGAYQAAFVLPNMIILFLITGMKDSFVPSYIHSLTENRHKTHLTQIFKGTAWIGLAITILGVVLSPYLVGLLYPDFKPAAEEVAVTVSRIYFAMIAFVALNAVLEGLLDAQQKFSFSVLSQVIVVVSTIGGGFLFHSSIGIYGFATGFGIGTVVSLIIKLGYFIPQRLVQWKDKIEWKEIKSYYLVFLPVGLTVMVGQINLLIDTIFANTYGANVVAYLNYAKSLVHFPQAIFGVTIGTIVLPILSKAVAKKDNKIFNMGIERGLTSMYLILFPSVLGMLVLMPNIIALVYERGAFGEQATIATSSMAVMYIGSVLFYSLHQVVIKAFYSLQKGHIILKIGLLSIVLKVILNFIFTEWIGYTGIALASSVVGAFYVGICFILLIRITGNFPFKKIGKELFKITTCGMIMYVAVTYSLSGLNELNLNNLFIIMIIAAIGAIIYGICIFLFKIEAVSFLLKRSKNEIETTN
ncbi:murein biosynthesis integral membrane protein MurJ [Alkalihalobacillus sp. AL-G]|uniref:murein biosynthesis integral membrane protein MurJ n=1 Tax=Alkalihalobacillus sp. AL-G TaxID=2926399 RepID=UPI00272B33AE|nr:murein biosynthesis integral membrane protein MurJ [Alkalihalobacillus sp. AL-G]WLD92990.1 murein biosynthesis integral membrane protein MurJ [Alkalihalobacillus sp. AL-G]